MLLQAIRRQGTRRKIPIVNNSQQKPKPGTHRYEMMMRLRKGGYRSRYRLRKQTVEPVFGQIKHARGFRQFLLRGIEKVEAEWSLICTAHNLLKLAQAQA